MLIINTPLLIMKHDEAIQRAEGLASSIGGQVKNFYETYRDADGNKPETCTLKLSYALNYAGADITNDNKSLKSRGRFLKGGDDKYYLISVPDIIEYLSKKYHKATNIKKSSPQDRRNAIRGKIGILTYGHRHVDIWCKTRHNSNVKDLMDNTSVQKRGLFFWEIPDMNVEIPPMGVWIVKTPTYTWIYTVAVSGNVNRRDISNPQNGGQGNWSLGAFGTINFQWNDSNAVEIWNLPPLPNGDITGIYKMENKPRYTLTATRWFAG